MSCSERCAVCFSSSFKGQKSDVIDGLANQTLFWVSEIRHTAEVMVERWEGQTLDSLHWLFLFTTSCSASDCLSSLVGNMKAHFAPLNVPFHRRLQTIAVLQWVYSFLGLGEFVFVWLLIGRASWWRSQDWLQLVHFFTIGVWKWQAWLHLGEVL